MTTLDYGRGRYTDDEFDAPPQQPEHAPATGEKLNAPTSFQEPEDTADEKLSDGDREELADRARETLTTLFQDRDLPSPKATQERLDSAWTAFSEAAGPEARSGETARGFKIAAVYSLTNTAITDPTGEGPMAYVSGGPTEFTGTGDHTADHTETSHLRFIERTVESAHDWDPRTETGAEKGVHHVTHIRDAVEANERHISEFTDLGLTNPPADNDAVFWGRDTAENTAALQGMTSNFTDTSTLDALLSFQQDSMAESQDTLRSLNGEARGDEIGMLHLTASSAAIEYQNDRTQLGQILDAITNADPTHDNTHLHESAADLLAHMDFAHGITDHAAMQAQLEVEDLLHNAHNQDNVQGRLAGVIAAHRGH